MEENHLTFWILVEVQVSTKSKLLLKFWMNIQKSKSSSSTFSAELCNATNSQKVYFLYIQELSMQPKDFKCKRLWFVGCLAQIVNLEKRFLRSIIKLIKGSK
jgi:hypothetical protein